MKTRSLYLVTGILALFILACGIFLLVTAPEPMRDTPGVRYEFLYYAEGGVIRPGTSLLIPALVNEHGDLVFSEKEVSDMVKTCDPQNQSFYKNCNRFSARYVTTANGTMISLEPRTPYHFRDDGTIWVILKKGEAAGDTIAVTSVSGQPYVSKKITVPVVIPDNAVEAESSESFMSLSLMDCRYNAQRPGICRGYVMVPDQEPLVFQGNLSVEMTEFGETGYLRRLQQVFFP